MYSNDIFEKCQSGLANKITLLRVKENNTALVPDASFDTVEYNLLYNHLKMWIEITNILPDSGLNPVSTTVCVV